MKQRLLSAAIGIPIAAVVLLLYNTIVLNLAMDVVILMSVYEIFIATKYIKNSGLIVVSMVFAAFVPFFNYNTRHIHNLNQIFCFLFMFVLFIFLLKNHKTMGFEQIGTTFMLTLLLSFSFSSVVFIRDFINYTNSGIRELALFYILIVFIAAWGTDAGAYFIGRVWGKHKLSPNISPKKTIEGAVGGILCTIIINIIAGIIFYYYSASYGRIININYWILIALSIVFAVLAILGDLAASLIKRECDIKDFGNILPGHGGVLDRFDSFLFVAPTVFIAIQLFPVVGLK
jgi:phosphatidate cytidylyltransferase